MRMSPERPPSQDSGGGGVGGGGGGGGGCIGASVTQIIEPQNMVLSAIPQEPSHVTASQSTQHRIITSQHQQQLQQQQIIVNGNSYATVHSSSPQNIVTNVNNRLKAFSSSMTTSQPKYVVFHQNGTSQYATVSEPTPTTTYITTPSQQSNGVGNIVVLATERLDVNHLRRGPNNGTDEDLTSLSWLHDKNLINNIVSYSNTKSATASPVRQSNNSGALSPTSDFLEDSCVSEDNASSANSSSDQGISVHSSDLSPTVSTNGFGTHHQTMPTTTNQFQNGYPTHHIQYSNNNNNNSNSKNRNHILSPSSSFSTSSQLAQETTNGNLNATSATTTVHVGPSGTTTVVEYKAGSNFIPSPRHLPQVPSSPQRTPTSNTIFVHTTTSSTPSPTASTPTTYHQQHFHKKYLREQMNGFDQNNSDGNRCSSDNRDQTLTASSTRQTVVIAPNQPTLINEINHYSSPVKTIPTEVSYVVNGQDDLIKEGINFENQNSNSTKMSSNQKQAMSPKQKHPTNLPYDPQVHTNNKPPYSFSSLIFMAIEDSPEKALPVKEIYAWIVQHFPYFKTAPTGWKNSVRHNLSLNKSFLKVEKAPNMGKGSLWRVEQSQRANLIQALTRSPFFPCAAVDKLSQMKSPSATPRNSTESPSETPLKSLDAKLFPKLSKMIKEMVNKGSHNSSGTESTAEQEEGQDATKSEASTSNVNGGIPSFETIERLARDCGADNIDDVNAAAAMLALKHGPKVFGETFPNGSPVITSSPSEDHTYSAGNGGTSTGNNSNNTSENNSNCNSSDGVFDSRETSPVHNITPEELEEQRRHAEGVDALLSFATKISSLSSSAASSPVKRPSSTSPEDEHISSYAENIPSLVRTATNSEDDTTLNQRMPFNSEGYFNHLLSPSPAKKLKTTRTLRTKIKRKATWLR